MKTVFLLSDANRWDYLEFMPFLNKIKNSSFYIKQIRPGIGFCEISEYISGISSLKNGNLFQITFNGNYGKQKYKFISAVDKLIRKIPKIRSILIPKIDWYISHYCDFYNGSILNVRYAIPIALLNYFMPTESLLEYDDYNFFGDDNLLLEISNKGFSYDIDDFVKHNKIKETDDERLNRLESKIMNKELQDFTLLYIGKGEIAHITGTNNPYFHKVMKEYDTKLNRIYNLLKENYKDEFAFIILGDHGMVDVDTYIDVKPILNMISKMKIRLGYDYVYFIDSTCFRLWIRDGTKVEKIDRAIKECLDPYLDYSIDNTIIDTKYGDLIYFVKPGIMFYPDFFNNSRKRGMHGYQNKINEQMGMCIAIGKVKKGIKDCEELTSIKNLVKEIMEI